MLNTSALPSYKGLFSVQLACESKCQIRLHTRLHFSPLLKLNVFSLLAFLPQWGGFTTQLQKVVTWPSGQTWALISVHMQPFFSKYYHVLVTLWWNASGHWAPVTCIVVTCWAATWARGSYPAWSSENFRQQKSRQIKSHLFIKRCFFLNNVEGRLQLERGPPSVWGVPVRCSGEQSSDQVRFHSASRSTS